MSENNLGGQGSPPRPGQGSAPRAPKPSVPRTGKASIPRPVLLGVLGVVAAAAAGAIVVFHPGMPQLLPNFTHDTAPSNSTAGGSVTSPGTSQRAGEAGSTPAGESQSSGHAGRQRSVTASQRHSSSQSSALSSSSRTYPWDPDVKSMRVSFRDLDLHTQAGACTALKRIKYAAAEVCPDDDPPLGLWHVRQECMQDSISRAIEATHNAKLQALYSQKPTGC